MVKIVKGNILNAKEDIICHQVNVQGVMGGGVARQLANKFELLEPSYKEHCKEFENDYEKLQGSVFRYFHNDKKITANIFSQKPNFDTDYEALEKALNEVKNNAIKGNLTVCMPYGIGCGIAHGDWNEVYKIIEDVFNDYEVTLYKFKENQ